MSAMEVTWTFHRFARAESRWIETADAAAAASPGVLARAEPELEGTLALRDAGGATVLAVRDTLWPLAWRFCLEPISALLGEAPPPRWLYRCFASATTYTLTPHGDELDPVVQLRKNQEEAVATLAARPLWLALADAGARVTEWAERDGNDGNARLLRPAVERAQAALRQRGWR